jgi:uncharacterized protein (DUF4415 family)
LEAPCCSPRCSPANETPNETPKEKVTLRLDADVLQFFQAHGSGWQTRLNDALKGVVSKASRP